MKRIIPIYSLTVTHESGMHGRDNFPGFAAGASDIFLLFQLKIIILEFELNYKDYIIKIDVTI